MIERTLLIGYGEVGRAHFNVLAKQYPGKIFYKDKAKELIGTDGDIWHRNDSKIDLLLIATQCNPEDMLPFLDMCEGYAREFSPNHIDILTTTPCGTAEDLQEMLRDKISVTKSSIRGMHPHLDKFLIDIPKHIGGPNKDEIAEYYSKAGITCIKHEKSRTVELCHVLNNFIYGCNIMATDEAARYAREYGVDWLEILKYRESQNAGFIKAGYPSKVSPLLYPSGGSIGGHCITYAPTTIPEDKRGKLGNMLADYNK